MNPEIIDHQIDYISSYQYEAFFGDQLFFKFVDDDDDTYGDSLDKIQFNEFMKFLKNPETYKDAKKYNL